MKKFIFKVIIVLAPIGLVLSYPAIILYGTGESLRSLDYIVNSVDDNSLIGYAYNQSNVIGVKGKFLKQRKFDVVAVGSSRVLEFREEMFTSEFYNGGWTISGIKSFKSFLESIPEDSLPEIIIVGLDQNFFNPNWDDLSNTVLLGYLEKSFINELNYNLFKSVYSDLFSSKYSLNILQENSRFKPIGLAAALHNDGFRKDGSRFYNNKINNLLSIGIVDCKREFKKGISESRSKEKTSFMGAGTVNINAISELNALFQYCKDNHIYVVSFIPPIAGCVLEDMEYRGNHDYLIELPNLLEASAESYGFEFYNYSHPNMVGSSDLEMLDEQHGSEVMYAKVLLEMINSNSRISKYVNKEQLKEDLSNQLNRYTIYPYGN